MQDFNKFIGGMNRDVHESIQPENTTRELRNFVALTEDGNLYSVTNENGTELFNVTFPEGMKVIGYSILNNEIIVILCSEEGYSQVGVIRDDSVLDPTYGKYHPIAPYDTGTESVPIDNSEFGFSLDYAVKCRSRKLINGDRILYYTDNNVPFGQVNLDNPPEVGTVREQSSLVFSQSLPNIEITNIVENVASTIKAGVTQFVTRYITKGGGVTTFSLPSNPLPMVAENRNGGVDNYKGAPNSTTVSKNIELTFSNVDTQYQELEIIAITYEGDQNIMRATSVASLPITSDTIEYTYTGPDTDSQFEITLEELRQVNISYNRAKTLEQKDNTLFLSNLSRGIEGEEDILQGIANKVEVSYKITEVPFSGRGNGEDSSVLSFAPLYNPYFAGPYNVEIEMSEDVDTTSGTTLSNYTLNKGGTPGEGSITITDYTLVANNDTITISSTTAQPAVILTAKSASPGDNEFLIGGSNDETAENLANAINSSDDIVDYYATVSSNVVTIVWNVVDLDSNSVTITLSGSGISRVNPSGASTTTSTVNPTAASVDGNTIYLTFADYVTISDTISFNISNSALTSSYNSGTDGLEILIEAPDLLSINGEQGFTDYINEGLTLNGKGYRRGEVYSLGFYLLYKDGSTTPVFHIPGEKDYFNEASYIAGTNKFEPTGGWSNFSTSPTSSARLGTYVSTLEYPLDQNYPGDDSGDDTGEQLTVTTESSRLIRHHYMPELHNEPHFRVDGDSTYIRILGLDFEFTESIPDSILEKTEEVVFVRQRRNEAKNRSVLAQGIVSRTVVTADTYTRNGRVDGNVISGGTLFPDAKSGYYLTETPLFDNMFEIEVGEVWKDNGDSSPGAGLAWPTFNAFHTGTYNDGENLATDTRADQVIMHGPEIDIYRSALINTDSLVGAQLNPELKLSGEYTRITELQDEWVHEGDDTYLKSYFAADYFGNYNNYTTDLLSTVPEIEKARTIQAGRNRIEALDTAEPGMKTGTKWSPGGLELLLDSDIADHGGTNFKIYTIFEEGEFDSPVDDVYRRTNVRIEGTTTNAESGSLNRDLYNLRVNIIDQYNQLNLSEFIPISRKVAKTSGGSFITTYEDVFGGDTFINKYSYNNTNLIYYRPLFKDGNAGADVIKNSDSRSETQRPGGYLHEDGSSPKGWDLRSCNYFFVESDINTDYRHLPEGETKQNYYPNEPDLSVLLENFLGFKDNIRTYNTQYSYDNTIKPSFTRSSSNQIINKFENRTIYSETASNDDTADLYRSFLANNFYDLPAHTGPIWNSFVEYNMLFLHTPKSLWRTFAEPAATLQGGNISDVVLGTGSLFQRPSVQMLTTEGGYAGTISQFAGTNTPMGYIFPDILQGKVFVLGISSGGPTLKELSQDGMSSYFLNLPDNIIKTGNDFDLLNVTTEGSNLIDNPYNGKGILGVYDHKLKRFIMTKKEDESISFSIALNKWFSFHDYIPDMMIPFDNRVFFVNNTTETFWEMNKGNKGSYFGTVNDSILEYVCAKDGLATKTFGNLQIMSDSFINGLKVRDDNFYKLKVTNDRNNSGDVDLIIANGFNPSKIDGQTFVKYRNDSYNIAIPRSAVIDPSLSLEDADNLYSPVGGNVTPDEGYYFGEKIKGNYAKFRFNYNNSLNLKFILHGITTLFRMNIR